MFPLTRVSLSLSFHSPLVVACAIAVNPTETPPMPATPLQCYDTSRRPIPSRARARNTDSSSKPTA